MVTPAIKVLKEIKVTSLVDAVGVLARKEVLVGIPAEHSSRQAPSTTGDKINNAELLYIQSHGVRKAEMRAEMQQHLDAGKKYSEAHSLYIQSHGSPLWHIPPRPVLEPSVEANKEPIAKQLQQATVAALDGDSVGVDHALHRAGFVAENNAGWPCATGAEAIAEAIERAVTEKENYAEKSKNASACIEEHFSWGKIAQKTREKYKEITRRKA
jgi:hypothetical protein